MRDKDRRSIVICIGNELIADDAVGFEVYRRLEGLDGRVVYCSTGGIDLLPLLEGETDLIVVDAVQLGAPPGTLHCIEWDSLPSNNSQISAHGLGLREALEIGRILYPEKMPERITMIGVEGRCFNRTREYMTPEVFRAIESAVTLVRNLQGGEGE